MLLEYRVNNFGSFKEDAVLRLKPGKVMSRFEDNVIHAQDKLKVLKGAVIVGENAGGKTGFMRSLHYLQYLFSKDTRIASSKKLMHKYEENTTQRFEIVVVINDTIYTYKLEIDRYGIVDEELLIRNIAQTKNMDKQLFRILRKNVKEAQTQRNKDNKLEVIEIQMTYGVEISDNTKWIDKKVKDVILKNVLNTSGLFIKYFSAIGVEIVKPFIEWMQEKLIVELPGDHNLNFYKKVERNELDYKIMQEASFLDIFRLVDPTIIKIEIDKEQPFEKSIVVRKGKDDKVFRIELEFESSGTREFFAWAIQIWKVIYNNCTLFADEVDKVLNVILSQKIVALVHGSEHMGQFIYSTHNVLHLDTNHYMKEQLYFVSKDRETLTSEIYSLADIKGYRYDKWDVYDLYLRGVLGGTPND